MSKNIKYQLLMVLAMGIWGGSWVCAKAISHDIHFQKLVLIRFVLTFLFFIPPVIIFREDLRIGWNTAKKIIIGTIFYTLYSQMFFLGLSLGSAGLGGILVTSLVPIITFGVITVFSGRRMRFSEAAGLVTGLAGSLVILKIWSFSAERLLVSGNIFFILGAALWSGVTINSQQAQSEVSIWVYSFYLNGLSVLLQAAIVLPFGTGGLFPTGVSFWLFMIYLSLLSTVFATSLYFYTSKQVGPHRASAFTFLVPSSAVILSWIFLREIPEITTLAGGCMSVAAVYLIQFRQTPGAQ